MLPKAHPKTTEDHVVKYSATVLNTVMRRVTSGAMAAGLLALLTGCDVGKAFAGFGWPQGGVTEQSHQMYDLWIGSVVAALAVGFFVWGLIFWCVVRYRRRGKDLPAQTRFNLPIEVLYTVVPFLVIAVLFYYTVVVQTKVAATSASPDTTVEVVGFRWNWQFNYRSGPGEAAQTVATTTGTSEYIPVLVVPTGETIQFELTANDVIHSFWVPELLFKRDVFPGSDRTAFQVTVDEEGRYVGRCAELCGTYHSMMNFELVAVPPDTFDRFLAELQAGKTTPQAMEAIGFTGAQAYAVTTKPFPGKPETTLS